MIPNTISRLLIGSLLTGLSGFANAAVFEDFSGPVSLNKFYGMEETIRLDTTNDNLSFTARAKAYDLNSRGNNLSLIDNTTSLIQADISIGSVELGNNGTQNALLSIAGYYYNAKSANPTSQIGDVFVRLALGDRGNGQEAWYEVQESTTNDFSDSTIVTGSFGAIDLDTAYPTSIAYDGDKTFTFVFNNGTAVNVDGPARVGGPSSQWRAITQRLRFGRDNDMPDAWEAVVDNGTPASITGTIDNVTTDDGLVDDFLANDLDNSVWWTDQTSVALVDDKLEMRVTGQGGQRTERFWIKREGLNTFGAKITLLSSSTQDADTRIRGRLTHVLSNDTYDVNNGDTPNGWEGIIWTQFYIEKTSNDLRAVANTVRATDTDFTTEDELFWINLGPVNFDQEYDMLIEKTGTLVEYKMDGAVVHSFNLATDHDNILSGNDFVPVHDEGVESGLQARIQDGPGEVRVLFDDIVTDYMPQALTLNAFDQDDKEVDYPDGVVVHEGEQVDLIAKVADPDDILAYVWEQESGPDVTAARGTTAAKTIGTEQSFSFKVPKDANKETLGFKVTLVDNAGVESSQQFSLEVDNSETSTFTGDDGKKKSGGGGSSPLTLLIALFMLFGFARHRRT